MQEGSSLLQVRGLSKRFGDYQALDDVTFDIRPREIVGLIGPNGAGKTTLLEGLAGLMPLDRGEVLQHDALLPASERKKTIFYLPDGILPYPELSLEVALAFFARLYSAGEEQLSEVVGHLGLESVLGKRVSTLSKGYRRRFLLAIALLSSQPLLALDEPFDGLDLRQTLAVMDYLEQTRTAGRTLLLAVHQLSDAERICDRFILLDAGRMLGFGTLEELKAQATLSAGRLEDVFLALT